MSQLRAIALRFRDENDRNEAWIARQMGVSSQTLNSWWTRGLRTLPKAWMLRAFARVTKTPYQDVIFAALEDTGYWPASVVSDQRPVEVTARHEPRLPSSPYGDLAEALIDDEDSRTKSERDTQRRAKEDLG